MNIVQQSLREALEGCVAMWQPPGNQSSQSGASVSVPVFLWSRKYALWRWRDGSVDLTLGVQM